MGGYPNPGTPADMRLAENRTPDPMPGAGDPAAGDMPPMSHQLVAPAARNIEPPEYAGGMDPSQRVNPGE